MKFAMVLFLFCGSAVWFGGCSKNDSNPAGPTGPTGPTGAVVGGEVFRQGTRIPVVGASITIGSHTGGTDSLGRYQIAVSPGSWNVTVDATKYASYSGQVVVTEVDVVTPDTLYLNYSPWQFVGNTIAIPGPTGYEYTAGLGNTLYFGTPDNTGAPQFFIAYNVISNTYAQKNLANNDLCACGYNSFLVAANNRLFYFANSGTMYDPSTDKWDTVSYPLPRGEAGVGVLGNLIYYIGGRGPLNTCQVYDATTNSWKSFANYPFATFWSAVTSSNGLLYVMGGDGIPTKMNVYDPSSNVWTPLPDLPFNAGNYPRAMTYNGKIFLFSDPSAGSNVYTYDLSTSTWDTTILSSRGYGTLPVIVGNGMYLVGYNSGKSGYAIAKYSPQ